MKTITGVDQAMTVCSEVNNIVKTEAYTKTKHILYVHVHMFEYTIPKARWWQAVTVSHIVTLKSRFPD